VALPHGLRRLEAGSGVNTPGTKRSGRKETPTNLKIVTGKPGRTGINYNQPEVQPGPILQPPWLDEAARAKWEQVLQWCHWITPADGDVLAVYCDAWSRYLKAQALAIQAPILRDSDNRPFKNPAWTALNEAFNQLRSAGSELGLSPSSRSGIGVSPGERKPQDIADKYFGRSG
jgi:P27 family predicted phage terminase small subunit